jgi:hypothetical protein
VNTTIKVIREETPTIQPRTIKVIREGDTQMNTTTRIPFTVDGLSIHSAADPIEITPGLYEYTKADYIPAVSFYSGAENECGVRNGFKIPLEELPKLIAELSRINDEYKRAGDMSTLEDAGWILS